MSTTLMIAVTLAYLWTSGEQYLNHNPGYSVMFFWLRSRKLRVSFGSKQAKVIPPRKGEDDDGSKN